MESLRGRDRGEVSRERYSRGADIFERFQKLRPPTFEGAPDPIKFLEKYFLRSCRNEKIAQFLRLEQGSLTVVTYEARFDELSRYVPKALEDVEYKLWKLKEGLRPRIQSWLCAWDFEDFAELVDKAMRVEKDFEHTLGTHPLARDTLVRSRQAPLAPPVPARRLRVQPAGIPPVLPRRRCEYCGRDGHTTRFCYKRIVEEGNTLPENRPQ
ncbi:uncharacterized protein LOC131228112 [Magnolia sinica]|uniref:uncharacterized protein LOC131228112 n=1 Tax=Magnolia sinica TaxID=86752 RepID=UPI0026598464|nr:uncharacterized protein LOC131228112 [Magnolia sinica]